MTKYLLPALFLVLGALVWSADAADWPQWRGPERNDISRESGLQSDWPKGGPRLLWTFRQAGIGYSGPAIVGDRLYSMGATANKEYLFAVDLKTRKKLWSAEVGPRFDNGWGDGPRGTPTVEGELTFGIGGQGNLICVETTTGRKVWSKSFRGELKGDMMSGWGYSESPLVDGDQVVATPGGKLGAIAAFDKKTGTIKWRSKDFTDPAAYSSLIVAEAGGVRGYVQMTGKSVTEVSAKDGALLWRYPRQSNTAAIPTPIFADGHVYATSGYGCGCCLLEVGPNSEKEVYNKKNMENKHGGVVLVGDHVYGFSESGGWLCQNFKTGETVWSDRGIGRGSMVYADGMLYCYSESGTVALVEASPAGYKEHGRFKLPETTRLPRKGGNIWTHPVIANGKLYLRDQDLIFCFDISKTS
jgi:outer membrane protein assembly factor BamB